MSFSAIKAGQAFVELFARDQKLKTSLEENKRRVSTFVKTVALVGAAAIVSSAGVSIKAASNMEETLNKFNVVFGENREAMKAWGDEFASQVGRSQRQAAEFLAGTQDLLIPVGFEPGAAELMSKQITQLAVDVASFNNKVDADVMRDFQSALVGNGETVKKYGVVLNEAGVKAKLLSEGIDASNATNQQKVWARWQIILDGSTAAQGDAIRSSDSFANQSKRLQAQLEDLAASAGSVLIPVASQFLQVINATLGPLSEWIAKNPALIETLAGVAVALGSVYAAMKIVNAAQQAYAQRAIIVQALSGPKGWITLAAGLAVAAAATTALNDSLSETDAELKSLTMQSQAATDAIDKQAGATEKLSLTQREFNQRQEQIKRQTDEYGRSIAEINKLQEEQGIGADTLSEKLAALAKNQEISGRRGRAGRTDETDLTAADADELRASLIESATGFSTAIIRAKDEIGLLNGSLTETDITLREMADKGLPEEEAKELRATLDALKTATLVAESDSELSAIGEEIGLLNGTLTETEAKLQRLADQGLPTNEIEKLRAAYEELNAAKEVNAKEEAQEERKKSLIADFQQKQETPQDRFQQMVEDIREAFREGLISREDGNALLLEKQKEVFASVNKRINVPNTENTVDLRAAEGATLIAQLVRGSQNTEAQALQAAQTTAKNTGKIANKSASKKAVV